MKMIDIKIKDNARYVLVAILVDQPMIETIIEELRQRIGLNKQQIDYDSFLNEYKSLSYKLTHDEQKQYDQMYEKYELLEMFPERRSKNEYENLEKEILNWQNPQYNLELQIHQTLAKLGQGDEFFTPLLKAIVCNEIRDNDYVGRPSRQRVEHIRRDRIWYWKNKRLKGNERLGYYKISKMDSVTMKTVISAIKSYQSRLNSFERVLLT